MMRKGNKAGIVLAIINLVLIGVIAFFYLRIDRGMPKIEFSENNAIYERDMDQSLLLDGISAMDKADGDVTGRIVIEKIVENENNATAVVYYAVSDKTGNVSRASRVFPAKYRDNIKNEKKE